MAKFKGCKNYTITETEFLSDISTTAYTLVHDKTGARVVLLENDDDNKSFVIGFKTPQDNSTGVPHILEHSVLCGSEKYPVKDAMTEVGKGSLNTYMNAFTYPDRTLYPVASCNDKDFQNLMGVYLDAVFFPRVHKEKKIFMQEGWHYEMEDESSPITINGVVYNEMKGVYSSPESALSSYVLFSLFPDTQYGVESGGDPSCIPELQYDDFCNFHKKLYHPSNSRIFLYGDMNFEEKLEYIDREYLSKFERIVPDSEVKIQKAFEAPLRIEKTYSILESDEEKDSTFLTYNVVCSDYEDVKTTEAMNAINYALCSVPGAKLKEALIDAGIGKDVYSEMVNDTCQKVFSIVAQDANPEDEARFVEIIEDTIKDIIENGFDKKTLLAAITSSEFSYREADFGYYPKGIAYGQMTFEKWLYTDKDIFTNLKQNEVYGELRKGIEEGLFEKVLKERVLDNPHKTILVMKPEKGLLKKQDSNLAKKLDDLKSSLSKEEIKDIISSTKELKEYQETPNSEEALATIPTLSIRDIKKEYNKCEYSERNLEGIREIYTEIPSNGITYFNLCFNADRLPLRLIPTLSVLKTLLGYLNTKNFTYGDFINETNIKSGGINVSTPIYKYKDDTDKYTYNLEVRSKALSPFVKDAFSLIEELLFESKLEDKKRIKENLEQSRVRIQGFMLQSGHAVAVGRAKASFSGGNALQEMLTGMGQFRYIESILADFDNKFEDLVKDMKEVLSILIRREGLEINVGCEKKNIDDFEREAKAFINKLNAEKTGLPVEHVSATKGNEAFSSSSQVQYVALCGNFNKAAGLEYKGSLQVLRTLLNTEYLWTQVRLQGGAYGCFCSIGQSGDALFASYRDPKLKETLEVYKNTDKFIENYSGDEEDVERYIISTIGDYDSPLTPSMKVSRSYNFYKSGLTNEDKQKERDEILGTTPKEIRSLSNYITAITSSNYISCVGSDELLKKEGDVFDEVNPLCNQG